MKRTKTTRINTLLLSLALSILLLYSLNAHAGLGKLIKVITKPVQEAYDTQKEVLRKAREVAERAAREAYKQQMKIIADAQKEVEKALNDAYEMQNTAIASAQKEFEEEIKQLDESQKQLLREAQDAVSKGITHAYEEQKEELAKLKKEIESGVTDVAKKAEECLKILENIVKNGKRLVELIAKYGDHFPEKSPVNEVSDIIDPDFSLLLTDNLVRSNLNAFLSKEPVIPVDKDDSPDTADDYIILKAGDFKSDTARNIVEVSITYASCQFTFLNHVLEVHPTIKNVTIELSPKLVKEGDNWFVAVDARVTYINIDNFPNWGEKVIAGMANEAIHNPLFKEDITKYLSFEIPVLDEKRKITLQPEKAIIIAEAGGLRLKVKQKAPQI